MEAGISFRRDDTRGWILLLGYRPSVGILLIHKVPLHGGLSGAERPLRASGQPFVGLGPVLIGKELPLGV